MIPLGLRIALYPHQRRIAKRVPAGVLSVPRTLIATAATMRLALRTGLVLHLLYPAPVTVIALMLSIAMLAGLMVIGILVPAPAHADHAPGVAIVATAPIPVLTRGAAPAGSINT